MCIRDSSVHGPIDESDADYHYLEEIPRETDMYRHATEGVVGYSYHWGESMVKLQGGIRSHIFAHKMCIRDRQYSAATQTLSILLQEGTLDNTLQADVHARLGDAHYMQGHYTPAVRYYEEAYRLAPDNQVYALYMLSDIEGLKKEYKAQISALDKLVARHPNSLYKPRAMYDQGRAMELSGQHTDVYKRQLQ